MKIKIPSIKKLSKKDIGYLIQVILSWSFINLAFNMFGLWITKLLNESAYTYFENIMYEFVNPLLIQSAIFGICLLGAFLFMKNKKLSNYAFVLFQFVVLHAIFISHLKIHHGLHFVTTFKDFGLQYMSYSGQYLVDILYLYFPISGNFDKGLFMPDNLGTFYIHWILLNILYYFAITWITGQFVKVFMPDSSEIKA
ncbi:MAG: hypothetical protein ACYC25_06625 [Paludibacter sp.]